MELFLELLVTAALSFIFAFLLSKLVSSASTDSQSTLISAVDLPPPSNSSEIPEASAVEAPTAEEEAGLLLGNEMEWNSSERDEAMACEEVDGVPGRGGPEMEREEEEETETRLEEKAVVEELIEKEERTAEDRPGGLISVQSDGGDMTIENAVPAKKESLVCDEEEWEGIERSDLEQRFNAVVRTVESGSVDVLAKVGSDLQMQLYGLHKVATEGPCYEPQPSVLKAAARPKWHAWQRLGNMNPEVAMEQYITLLSDSVPGLVAEKPSDGGEQGAHNSPQGVSRAKSPDLGLFPQHQTSLDSERQPEGFHFDAKKTDPTGDPEFVEEGHSVTDSA